MDVFYQCEDIAFGIPCTEESLEVEIYQTFARLGLMVLLGGQTKSTPLSIPLQCSLAEIGLVPEAECAVGLAARKVSADSRAPSIIRTS